MAQPSSIFAYMKEAARHIVRMRDVKFEPSLFQNYLTGTALDELLCSYKGLPKGVNYMVIGDPGVGKTTIIMDMLSGIRMISSSARVLFISAEMNEIDLAVYVQRFPKFKDLDILFIKADFSSEGGNVHCLDILTEVFDSGWDVVAIDSFYELQGKMCIHPDMWCLPNTGGGRSVSGFTMISALKVMCFMMKSDSGRISRYGVSSQRQSKRHPVRQESGISGTIWLRQIPSQDLCVLQ